MATGQSGTIYLLHFDRRYKHAGHYIGWTTNLPARLRDHTAGHAGRLIAVCIAEGIGFTLARTWQGPRAEERRIKKMGGASRSCPICAAQRKAAKLAARETDRAVAA